jgi:hypothetical protein
MSNTDHGKLNDRDLTSLNELARLDYQALLKSLGKAINGEINQTTIVLRHLILVEERKLYAQNHSSLFDFLTRQYRYSENAAQRRIDAARLLREFPALEPKIQSRAHSLTNLSLARSLFRQEKKRNLPFSRAKKLEVLSAIEGKSTREASIYLLSQSSAPELLKKCKSTVRALGSGYTAFKIIAHEELTADLYHIRDLWAHAVPDGDWTEIMKRMVKLTLESIDPLKKAERAKARKERSHSRKMRVQKEITREQSEHPSPNSQDDHPEGNIHSTAGAGSTHRTQAAPPIEIDRETGEGQICFHLNDPLEPHPSDQRRHIAASIRHAVDLRDRAGGCTHIDENGNRCGSHRALEYDHRTPSALGGPDTVENLRLLCREHNSFHSYQIFGRAALSWRSVMSKEI